MEERDVLEALRGVQDPELGINVVDLGLVYDVAVRPGAVEVALTMTSPACPLGDQMKAEAESALRRAAPGASVTVHVVLDPPWHPALMSEAAKRRLGWS
jgi:metal-sulfur cluster biosynthetic enzyme